MPNLCRRQEVVSGVPQVAEIIPLVPVEGLFSYVVSDGISLEKGMRVIVPFGRRKVMGVVAEVSEGVHNDLKSVSQVLDDQPAFTNELLGLTEWIATYYMCSQGDVIKAALPKGLVWTGPNTMAAPVRKKKALHLQVAAGVDAWHKRDELRGEKQKALLELVASAEEPVVQADALRTVSASASTARSLVDKGILHVVELEVERRPDAFHIKPATPNHHSLHPTQKKAVNAIRTAVETQTQATFLLHGVTGSGKTEVYIRALKEMLDQGRTAIVLVPEIALTPQTVSRFRAHFGDRVSVLHSRMSDGERFDAWRAIRDGRYPIVIGPRSAVFAPLDNLGLIVVDEEHETSYKQFDPAPRYNARDVAVMRAHRNGAVCVLGSATPSLESIANAQAGKYTLLEMHERVPVRGSEAAALPTVQVVNLAREKEIRRLKGALSKQLRDAIATRMERNEQVILLQNRRGYAPILCCDDCGYTPTCRDCEVSTTVHKSKRQLRCHYCGLTERQPTSCPSCGSEALTFLGTGTQRIEEELEEVFPTARVLRMDMDTTSRKGAHRAILEQFERGGADILLGTQMVAKGLDFPRVTLVGVVNADTGMLMPDFRAEERTFQLLAQVAGRAGRHDLSGEVIIQSRNPEHTAIRFALNHDFHGFAEQALAERRALGYPPFGRMVGIEFKGPDEKRVHNLSHDWTKILSSQKLSADILGPTPAFIGRVKRQWRYHTILKAPRSTASGQLLDAVRATNAQFGTPGKGYRINIDVDPVGLY